MLVLARKRYEQIVIDQRITITVVQCGATVRLGIDAPAEVRVMRAEAARRDAELVEHAENFQALMGEDPHLARIALMNRCLKDGVPIDAIQDTLDWLENREPAAAATSN